MKEGVNRHPDGSGLKAAQKAAVFPWRGLSIHGPPGSTTHFPIPAGTFIAREERHGAGNQRHTLYFYFQALGLGAIGPGWATRPIHLEHGLGNIQWDRTTEWVRKNLLCPLQPIAWWRLVGRAYGACTREISSILDGTGLLCRSSTIRRATECAKSGGGPGVWWRARGCVRALRGALCRNLYRAGGGGAVPDFANRRSQLPVGDDQGVCAADFCERAVGTAVAASSVSSGIAPSRPA